MSLYGNMRRQYGKRTAEKVRDFFNAMQLPMPGEGEFSETDDKGYLVFLNESATVIRLTKKREGLWNFSRRVLHPLGGRITGKLRAEIFPGINCPLTPEQRMELAEGLGAEKLAFVDQGLYNGGTLPAVEGVVAKGYAVALDPLAVRDLSSAVGLAKHWLSRTLMPGRAISAEAPDDPQAVIYRPLKDLFRAAWRNGGARPDATLVARFWDKAREMKAEGVLTPGWLTREMWSRNYKNAFDGGLLYDQRLQLDKYARKLTFAAG